MIDLIRRGQSSVYGQVSDVVLSGRTVTNILDDDVAGAESATGWNIGNVGIVTDSLNELEGTNCLKITLSAENINGGIYRDILSKLDTAKHYLISAFIKNGNLSGAGIRIRVHCVGDVEFIDSDYITATTWTRVGIVIQPSDFDNATAVQLFGYVSGSETEYGYVDAIMLQEISASDYALGVDALLSKYNWHLGTKSTNSVRVKSVGKNLFDRYSSFGNYYVNTTLYNMTTIESSNAYRIKVSSNTQYSMKRYDESNLSGNGGIIRFEDINKNVIGGTVGGYSVSAFSFATPINCEYIVFSINKTILSSGINYQLEKGTTATEYEPYKESIVNVNLPEPLRSLPNGVKDEFNAVLGVKTQKVSGEYILQSSDLNTTITRDNYVHVITKNISSLGFLTPALVNAWQGTFRIDGWTEREFITTGAYYPNTFSTGVSIQCLYFQFPLGTTLTQAKTALAGTTLTYQLAEPVVTQLDPQPLTIFPNGTQYIEFGTKEVAEYADGINISNAEIPIKAMKTVDKLHIEDGHWKRTAIDLANVAVSPDGLSFTIADAVNGETYEYSYDYDSALSTLPDLDVGEPSLVTRNNRTIVL